MKNKKKNYNATMNSNINTNILINDNSTCSTLMPSINPKKLKKSNSCFYYGGNNEMNEIYKKVSFGGKKEEVSSGFNNLSSIKNTKHYRARRNLPNSKININYNRVENKTTNSFINNRKIKPFSSTREFIKDEINQIDN